jgi:hypothetical protein
MRPLADVVTRNRRRDETEAAGGEGPAEPDGADRSALGSVVIATVVAIVPVVVAAVRAIRADWVLAGDSAAIAVRSDDVVSADPPQLGLWAYTSLSHGFDYNHPGPLLFDVLAVPTKLFGHTTGGVLGNLVLHVVAVVGIVAVAYRRGGQVVALIAAATVALLCLALGTAALVEPWHANSVVLPFLCFLLLVWSVARGDVACLPWLALAGSFVLQTSLSYALLVPGLVVWSLVALWLNLRRRADDDDLAARAGLRLRARRRGLAALAVVAVCWARPIWEQLTGEGVGNISLLARMSGRSLTRLSPVETAINALEIAAVPPRGPRSDAATVVRAVTENRLALLVVVVLLLVAVGAAVAWCVRSVRRRHDADASSLLATAGVLVVLSAVTASRAPAPTIGDYQVRWMWPAAAFVLFALVTVVTRTFADRPAVGGRVAGAFIVATAVFAVLNLQASTHGTSSPERSFVVAADVLRQMGDVELDGPVLLKCAPPTAPYCQAMMAELDDRGVGFRVQDEGAVRSLGNFRSMRHPHEDELLVVSGPLAELPARGLRRVAINKGLDKDEQVELFFLTNELTEHLAEPGDHLTAAGRRRLARGAYDKIRDAMVGDLGGEVSFRFDPAIPSEVRRDISSMVEQRLMHGEGRWQEKMERFAELTDRSEFETVAVFVRDR